MRRALLVLAIVLGAREAKAESMPQLHLAYSGGGEGCPDEASFRRSVAQRLGYDPFIDGTKPADRRLVVVVTGESPRSVVVTLTEEPSGKVLGFEPLADKWAAFGWHVQRVAGNDLAAVLAAFDAARSLKDAKPRVILFDTLMGKGVPFLETRDKNHFIRVDPPEWQSALEVLDQTAKSEGALA